MALKSSPDVYTAHIKTPMLSNFLRWVALGIEYLLADLKSDTVQYSFSHVGWFLGTFFVEQIENPQIFSIYIVNLICEIS